MDGGIKKYVQSPLRADVLLGRGSRSSLHIGNILFRKLVMERKAEYHTTRSRSDKQKIAREIVNEVAKANGRFLKYTELTKDFVRWEIVGDDTIMEKTKQALRAGPKRDTSGVFLEKYVHSPLPDDVLLGRGSAPTSHQGTIFFRKLVMEREAEYNTTGSRSQKQKIALEIVNEIVKANGRFIQQTLPPKQLLKLDLGGDSEDTVWWEIVDDFTSLEATKQALRRLPKDHMRISSAIVPEMYVQSPLPSDVLLGRGSGANSHQGNIMFRNLVMERKAEYNATRCRSQKQKIALEIVDEIVKANGRFMQQTYPPKQLIGDKREDIVWWKVVEDFISLEKTKQALRQIPKGQKRKSPTTSETTLNVEEPKRKKQLTQTDTTSITVTQQKVVEGC